MAIYEGRPGEWRLLQGTMALAGCITGRASLHSTGFVDCQNVGDLDRAVAQRLPSPCSSLSLCCTGLVHSRSSPNGSDPVYSSQPSPRSIRCPWLVSLFLGDTPVQRLICFQPAPAGFSKSLPRQRARPSLPHNSSLSARFGKPHPAHLERNSQVQHACLKQPRTAAGCGGSCFRSEHHLNRSPKQHDYTQRAGNRRMWHSANLHYMPRGGVLTVQNRSLVMLPR